MSKKRHLLDRKSESSKQVFGVVKRSFPLQSLSENDTGMKEFGPGIGPCGLDATKLVVLEVENRSTYDSYLIFFYDEWAESVQQIQKHYKIHLKGDGLVAIEWETGEDTEDRRLCVVVASQEVLKKTAARYIERIRAPKVEAFHIELKYEEPVRLHDSDQVQYLPEKTINPDTLKDTTIVQGNKTNAARGKRSLRQMKGSYEYTCLGDLIPGNAHLYGVVVNTSLPKKSEGKDCYMSIQLIDESLPRREDAIVVVLFYKTIENMPRILHVGDVIRFHKVQVKQYQDKFQIVGHSRATRYVVIRERSDGSLEKQLSTENCTFEESDEERARELIKWSKTVLIDDITLPPGCPSAPLPLEHMRSADSFVDVLVQVLNVIPPYDSQAGKLVIWDGTGQLNAIDSYVQALSSTPQSFGICMEIRIESCWLVLEKMGFIQHIKDGWVRFRNLAVEQLPDDFNQECRFVLHFREVSSLVLMPTFVCEVQERLTWIDRRCISASARTAAERSIQNTSSTSFQDENVQIRTVIGEYAIKIPITSLEAIQNSKRVPNKYHCIAFVTSCWPSDIEKLTKLQQVGDKYEYVYSFVLRLQDFSGTIDVIVHGKDAEKFLRPIAPSDFSKSTPSKKILERKISALIQSRKLVHFCIKSYQVKQKQHPPEQSASQSAKEEQNIMEIRYRLFDTILL